MTIYNLGSINADYFYTLPHLPSAGETLAARSLTTGLGGKGANQTVAAARAGSRVLHIGAVGPEGQWAVDRLREFGADITHVATSEQPTGHAIINVDAAGENTIVILPGANQALGSDQLKQGLSNAKPGDFLILQNETNLQHEAAAMARDMGLRIIYSAAPFSVDAVSRVLDAVTILAMNAVEAEQMQTALGKTITDLPVQGVLITRGADGAVFHDLKAGTSHEVAAFPVKAVDTAGAGDTFTGYFAAGLDQGMDPAAALRLAAAGSAIQVTRQGTADAIPSRAEVDAFLRDHP